MTPSKGMFKKGKTKKVNNVDKGWTKPTFSTKYMKNKKYKGKKTTK